MLYLGLGTNEGDRLGNLRRAIAALNAIGAENLGSISILAISPVYESAAMLPPGAPAEWNRPYLNLALQCRSSLSPRELLDLVKRVERELGREARDRWAPRVIDIDLLDWEGVALRTPELTLPHAGLAERPFAMLPLGDLTGVPTPWRFLEPEEIPFQTQASPFSILPELVGVLNVTPDSFSDGGLYTDPARAVAQARKLVQEGATVVDVGAESTRPGATLLDPQSEWARLGPLLEQLAPALTRDSEFCGPSGTRAALSIDTRHAETARRAIALGADWINDVSGFEDARLIEAVADSQASAVVMHHLGVPPVSGRTLPSQADPLDALLEWGARAVERLERGGIPRPRIILDPGIGFGKTPSQTRAIIEGCGRLKALGCRVFVGHSRKSFLKSLTGALPAAERDLETQVVSVELARRGADYLRVHDVAGNLRALRAAFSVDAVISWGGRARGDRANDEARAAGPSREVRA